MNTYENLELNHRHWPIRAAKPSELAVFQQAAEAYPGGELLPHIRGAMFQRYPCVDDDELLVIRKSQLPLAAWHGLCEYIPRGTPAQLAQDEEGPVLVVERSILEMITAALAELIRQIIALITGDARKPGGGKAIAGSQGQGQPEPKRGRLLIEHDGPGF